MTPLPAVRRATTSHAGEADRSPWALLAGLILASLVLRAVAAAVVPLMEAEAYYWLWSRHLAAGYFDHPPMVAVLIRAGTALFGHGDFGVRSGHLLLASAGAWLTFRFARRLVGPRAALATLAVVSFAPFWAPFGIVATPDGPLLFFWTLALAGFWNAYRGEGTLAWLLAGLATGLALLSKYNAAQLPVVYMVFLLATPRGRAWLRRPGPWLALLLAGLLLLPNALFNVAHSGDTLATPLRGDIDPSGALTNLGQLALLPFLMMTPLLAWAWVRQSWVLAKGLARGIDDGLLFLLLASWLPLMAFGAVALLASIHAQWVATVFVAATPLALVRLDAPGPGPSPRLLRQSLWVGALLVALLALLPSVALQPLARAGWRPARRGVRELTGWDELAERLAAERRARGDFVLASLNYHMVSRLQWMTRDELPGLPLDPRYRNQYGYWIDDDRTREPALFVDKLSEHDDGSLHELSRWYGKVTPLPPVMVDLLGERIPRFELAWCEQPLAPR